MQSAQRMASDAGAAPVSLTLVDAFALLVAMSLLAAVPSLSVLAVTARAAAAGFRQGAWVTLGIVGGVKLAYAAAAGRAGEVTGPRLGWMLNRVAGGVVLAVGTYLMIRT